jgi:hypothetical protein
MADNRDDSGEAIEILESDPVIRSCWIYFEALRRIGFQADKLFVCFSPQVVQLELRDQGLSFIIGVGSTPYDWDELNRRWGIVCTSIEKIPDRVLMKIWTDSEFGAEETGAFWFMKLMTGLHEKGFVVTRSSRRDMN